MSEEQDESPSNPDIHFEPIVRLPLVETKTMEEDEETLVKLRAKLFRYDCMEQPAEWKERGTGEVKLLKHLSNGTVRVVMRRDKTFKICANHYVQAEMELKPNCNSDRAWVWSTPADFTDEQPKPELLAIRFANAENAQKFKSAFEDAKKFVEKQDANRTKADGDNQGNKPKASESNEKQKNGDGREDLLVEKLKDMSVKEEAGCSPEQEGKPNCKTKDSDDQGS